MYETYYDILQPNFGEKNLHLRYMDIDSFILSVNTKDIIEDSRNSGDIFDFSNLDQNHVIISKINKKRLENLKLKLPKIFGLMNSFV